MKKGYSFIAFNFIYVATGTLRKEWIAYKMKLNIRRPSHREKKTRQGSRTPLNTMWKNEIENDFKKHTKFIVPFLISFIFYSLVLCLVSQLQIFDSKEIVFLLLLFRSFDFFLSFFVTIFISVLLSLSFFLSLYAVIAYALCSFEIFFEILFEFISLFALIFFFLCHSCSSFWLYFCFSFVFFFYFLSHPLLILVVQL